MNEIENRWLLIVLGLLLAVALAMYFPWPEKPPGAPKYDVTGTVYVNGEPASGLIVRLFAENQELMNQDRLPVGMTDKHGEFHLSSFGGNDGAAEGRYVATFFWPTNIMEPTEDRLLERFIDPKSSQYAVAIPPEPTLLPPFEIEFSPEEMRPLVFGVEDLERMAASGVSPHQGDEL